MSFKHFLSELNNDEKEGYLLKSLLFSLISGMVIFFLFYFVFAKNISVDNWVLFSILSILSYTILMPSILQVKLYGQFPCMSGMMIGMTFGMIAGFLPGFYIAATNGMFYGSVFGMVVGIIFGSLNGKCCGVMGVMEGVMAGFMGGLMGAMTSIMLLNDHLNFMAIIILIVSSVIMVGLSYMLYKEGRNLEKINSVDYTAVILWSLLLSAITIAFMLIGPRGGIFS